MGSPRDPLCAVPVGAMQSMMSSGNNSCAQGLAYLNPGGKSALRPGGSDDIFRLRVYQPAEVFDVLLQDNVQACRGDRFVLREVGGSIRCEMECTEFQSDK